MMKHKPRYKKFDIGDYTYGTPIIYEYGEKLKIGRYCSIGPEVVILLGGEHYINTVSTYPFSFKFKEFEYLNDKPVSKGPVTIENDVWIGAGAMILSGVTIGNGAVIGARSLVTKNIPPYAIAVGNPAKVIRYRFNDEIIRNIEVTRWWEKSFEELKPYLGLLQGTDINDFIEKFKI